MSYVKAWPVKERRKVVLHVEKGTPPDVMLLELDIDEAYALMDDIDDAVEAAVRD